MSANDAWLPPARTPPRRRSAGRRATPERQAAIVDAATHLCLSEGYSAITVAALAERTGFVRPVIYDCFPTIDDVTTTMVADAAVTVRADLDLAREAGARDDGPGRLRIVLTALADAVGAHPIPWRVTAAPATLAPPHTHGELERLRADLLAVLDGALTAAIASVEGSDTADTEALSQLLLGITDTFINRFDPATSGSWAQTMTDFIASMTARTRYVS